MAQVVIKRENVRTKLKPATGKIGKLPISDWDSLPCSYWLVKIAFSPGLYDDAKLQHGWRCRCCSHIIFLTEARKKK